MEVKTNILILNFNSPKIPDSLKICYLNIPVIQYVPNPLRCYKCQSLVMLRVNASTTKPVPNDRKLVTKMNHVPRHLTVSTVEIVMLLTARNVPFLKRNLTFNLLSV